MFAEACLGTDTTAAAPMLNLDADPATVVVVANRVACLGQDSQRCRLVTGATTRHVSRYNGTSPLVTLCVIWLKRSAPATCGAELLSHTRKVASSVAYSALVTSLTKALQVILRAGLVADASAAVHAALEGAGAYLTSLGATEARLRRASATTLGGKPSYAHAKALYEYRDHRTRFTQLWQAMEAIVRLKWVQRPAVPPVVQLYAATCGFAV